MAKGCSPPGVSHRQRAPNYWLPTLLLGCNGARDCRGRSRAVCARTGSRAVQGISAADSGGRTGSGGVFAYPGKSSVFTSPECAIHTLAKPGEDYVGALDALAQLCRYAAKIAPWNKRSGRRCLAGRLPCRDWRGGGSSAAGELYRGRRVDDLGPRIDGGDEWSASA